MSEKDEKAQLYRRIVTGTPEWLLLEQMKLHGFWPEDEGLPADPPDEAAERFRIEKEIAELRKKHTKNKLDPDAALAEERKRRWEESKKKRAEKKKQKEAERKKRLKQWEAEKAKTLVHAGEDVSGGLQTVESNSDELKKRGLPVLHKAEQLAKKIGISIAELRWLTFHRRGSAVVHYHRYDISKKTGGVRAISAPKPLLSRAQHWILDQVLMPLTVSQEAHGFVSKRSIVTNAEPHTGRDVVINMDLKDFFPSITFRRVKGLFVKVGYSEHLATVLSLLCTEPPRVPVEYNGQVYHVALSDRRLPQGACTSPQITNLICYGLDQRLRGLAAKHNFAYTRYADDLTFSGDDPRAVGKLLKSTRSILMEEGFEEHPTKTRVMHKGRRQEVTGVTVNHHVTISRTEYRNLRATLYNAARDGLASQNRENHPNFAEHLKGKVAFVTMVDAAKGAKLQPLLDAALNAQG